MGQFGIAAPEIVRGNFSQSESGCILSQDEPDTFVRQRFVCQPAAAIDRPEYSPTVNAERCTPLDDCRFRPVRHRHRADPSMLAQQINNYPSLLALLDVIELQPHGFGSA